MLARGKLERVVANRRHALRMIDTAERNLKTARLLAGTSDQGMAFTALYDASRKSLAAVLAVLGLRVKPIGGAHRNTWLAVSLIIDAPIIKRFDWMRQVRNATEYPDDKRPEATESDVTEGLMLAEEIVAECVKFVR